MPLPLYVGIDIGKRYHAACMLSTALLFEHHGRYERCPTLSFEQSRSGFEALFSLMTSQAPTEKCHVLLENTGHYGRALEQFLQEKGVQVYQVHAQGNRKQKQKSDKRDAQALAVMLYNQIENHILVSDKRDQVHGLVPPSDAARLLRGLVQHRVELVRETTQRKNKLTAIVDEIFPELATVYKDPNNPSALHLRENYPTPQAIADAPLADLLATRKREMPSRARMIDLQVLARQTIGTKDQSRLKSLLIEQKQLIDELRLLNTHVDALNVEIEQTVIGSREGQILTSFPMIGPTQAAMLIAAIGSIANFESVSKLRGYCGWSPLQQQTGTSMDTMILQKSGNRLLKQAIYFISMSAIRLDPTWKALYDRLVPQKCAYDERLKRYRGRMKVIGRIAGQVIGVIYVLLKRDYDLLQRVPLGEDPPPPELYDPRKHQVKRLPSSN